MPVEYKQGRAVCKVRDVKAGQRLDLQNDIIADPEGYAGGDSRHPEFACEFSTVLGIVRETEECICLYFDGFTCAFPPDHEIEVDAEQNLDEPE